METEAKKTLLKDIAEIRPGYPFRATIKAVPGASAAVVQIRNVDIDVGIYWPAVIRTKLTAKRKPDWLRPGDILFSAHGERNIAVCVDNPPDEAVCSPRFFLARIKRGKAAMPEFVSWLINQPEAQRYLAQSAEGSYVTNIRKAVFERMPLSLPSIERQKIIVSLSKAAQREKQVMKRLIANRERQLNAISRNLLG